MCRPGELTAKYFASKTCLISFLKPFQWRWNCLVSVYYLTPGGFHNGHQNRWVVTDTSWSLAVAVHTRGSIPTAEFLFFSDLGRMILEPEIRMDHYILFLIYQFKCIAVTWGLFGIFNRGKKVFKNYTLQPRIQWAGHINYEYIYCIFVAIPRMILCGNFSKLEVISGIFSQFSDYACFFPSGVYCISPHHFINIHMQVFLWYLMIWNIE